MSIVNANPSFVNLLITNNVNSIRSEKRYNSCITVAEFKSKLELVTGCNHKHMTLDVFDSEDKRIGTLSDDMTTLEAYNIQNGMRVHVTDPVTQPISEAEITESTEKFEIDYEEYAKRDDTVLAWKRRMKIGQFKEVDPDEAKAKEEAAQKAAEEERMKAESINIGDRCEIKLPNQPVRRGLVKYVGNAHFKPGYWVGLQYDEPIGKHDGSLSGHRYFECPEKYGSFVKPQNVETGDFPEFGLDELDEI